MGAGDFPAGAGLAGFDVPFIPGQTTPFLPRAVFYDPTIQQFLLQDEQGNYIDMHPIDQIVVLRLCTRQGQSKSDPTLGTRLARIAARQPPAKVPNIALAEVKRVLQDLIDARDILLVSVKVDNHLRGQNIFKVSYVNLRDPSTNRRFPLTNQQHVSIAGVNT